MSWKRLGECCKCGDCCKGNPRKDRWHDAEDGMCPLLGIVQKDGTRLCTGYGVHEYYLQGCVVWPSIPAHTASLPRCTYRWEWVNDGH